MMKTRWMIPALLLATTAVAAQAQEPKEAKESKDPKEAVDVLRQRLAERLSTKGEGAAAVKPAAKADARKAAPKADAPRPHAPVAWGYTGDGAPEHWAELSPENRVCGTGTRQSPIDLRDGIAVNLEKIAFDYRASPFAVLDTGRTIQVNVGTGNGLTVMGRRYELVQFHFHRPSEERINGRQYDMDVHLVHKDAEGRVAIVAVLLERGRDQPLVQTVWNNLPLEKGDALPAQVSLDLTQLLPEDRGYFTYMGSLTEPPCTEGVLWMVMRQPVQLSAAQLGIFGKLYPMNARPLQAGSGRLIKESTPSSGAP